MHARLIVSALALVASAAVVLTGAAVTSAAVDATTTPVGSVLKVGKPAIVPYTDSSSKPEVKATIQVTPESITKGSIKDFANIKLDATQKTATPYYMKVLTKNVGKTVLKKARPDLYLNGVDDRGQRQSAIIFFGDFARCSMDKVPAVLKPGQSYEVCQAFLIAKGGSIDGAVWVEFDPKHPTKSDINWKR
jgi:hypothetical protein